MEIEEALTAYLKSKTALTALISTRIYPDTLPQNVSYPAITYQLISESEIDTFHQPDNTMMEPTFQFSCWGKSRASANAVAKQLRLAFKNFSGVMGGGVYVNAIQKVSRMADMFTDATITDYRTMLEFKIFYQEVT